MNYDRSAVRDSSGRDVKHEADMASERAILKTLDENNFDYPILSEESRTIAGLSEDHPSWVIDPLDGTLNYSMDIGLSCISIALWKQNPILGVVYDFNRNELFLGIVGDGAWCNDNSLEMSDLREKEKAVLATGFPVNRDFSANSLKEFLENIIHFKKIRLFGSAALSLAYVACGRVDAYVEEDIMFWDVAAGVALVQAAGGFVQFENSSRKNWAMNVKAGFVFI